MKSRGIDSISWISSPTPKRHKLQNYTIDDDLDRISKLPDGILGHILSFLPVRDAERTGALSTRWKSLWALLPDLELGMPCKNRNPNFVDTFTNFVEKTLVLRNGLPLRRFRLSGMNSNVDSDRVYDIFCTAISNAISCRVEEIELYYYFAMDRFRLPWNPLMNCTTLVGLKLGWKFVLDVPRDVFFPTLKCLHLYRVIYSTDASLERLLSACPVLEELHVERCSPPYTWGKLRGNILRLNVSMPYLKRLSLENEVVIGKCKHELVVDAPTLENLTLYDDMFENYIFENLASIVKVELHIVSWFRNTSAVGDQVIGLLRNISAVKTLKLSKDTMMTLGHANDKVLPTFYNLVCLALDVDEDYGWQFLPSYLESMPNLESLIFAAGLVPLPRWRVDGRKRRPFEFNWHPPEVVPACLLFKLQTIEIWNDGPLMKEELKLIKYLLANAMRLKTMKICRRKMDQKTRIKLAAYHRGSDSCQIVLLKSISAFWTPL